jgi:hypothetical protein
MLTRRALLTGGMLTGTAAGAGAAPGASDAPQSSRGSGNSDEQMVKALEAITDQLKAAGGSNNGEVGTIRLLQREFLKGHGKFPDFIEIGIDIWESVVNWHVRTRQQPQVTRTAEGRYSIAVFQTNLILRHDVSNNYIGAPYDSK